MPVDRAWWTLGLGVLVGGLVFWSGTVSVLYATAAPRSSSSSSATRSPTSTPTSTSETVAPTPSPPPLRPSNIIFVLLDDIGWGGVGYMANDPTLQHQPGAGGTNWTPNPVRTPHLDAIAGGKHTMRFTRYYAGSPVCSPTRSAVLTGRTPDRECITGANGCGQQPAERCAEKLPLPPTTFTAAEAAKRAGMHTIFLGKWHLGDFWHKTNLKLTATDHYDEAFRNGEAVSGVLHSSNTAYKKWPVSNPGLHGFDEWDATEASAASSACNCKCFEGWKQQTNCVKNGRWVKDSGAQCINFWRPAPDAAQTPACRTTTAPRECVTPLSTVIGANRDDPEARDSGDTTEYMLNGFEAFLDRTITTANDTFFAALFLHTNHEPITALPPFYFNYTDVFGNPAGNNLGAVTQMDAQLGRLYDVLEARDLEHDTMVVITADNGVHGDASDDHDDYDVRFSTNGLRQCKASVFEGGLRVPGLVTWPAAIQQNTRVDAPFGVYDFLPTMLELLGVDHPHPEWATDGRSMAPLLRGDEAPNARRPPEHPLCFTLGSQHACIDNEWKLVRNPKQGQCQWNDNGQKPSYLKQSTTVLFNLASDPTETVPLNADEPERYQAMSTALDTWLDGVKHSAKTESECA